MADEEDFSSLSLTDRVSHSSWKARLSAYEEISKQESPEYSSFLVGIAKEKNQIALETGLLAIKKYLEIDTPRVKDTISHILPSLASNRSATKERIIDIVLSVIYMDGGEFITVIHVKIVIIVRSLWPQNPKGDCCSGLGHQRMYFPFWLNCYFCQAYFQEFAKTIRSPR